MSRSDHINIIIIHASSHYFLNNVKDTGGGSIHSKEQILLTDPLLTI